MYIFLFILLLKCLNFIDYNRDNFIVEIFIFFMITYFTEIYIKIHIPTYMFLQEEDRSSAYQIIGKYL
jgi:hypothetical protein